GVQLGEQGEGSVDLVFRLGLQDRELQPLCARRFLQAANKALGIRIVRVHEQGDQPGLRDQFGKQLEPLGQQLGGHECHAREVAARPGKAVDQAHRAGSPPLKKTMWIVEVALFAASAAASPVAAITSTLLPTKSAANAGSRSSRPSAQLYL